MTRPYRLAKKLPKLFDLDSKIDTVLSASMFYLNQFIDSERSSVFRYTKFGAADVPVVNLSPELFKPISIRFVIFLKFVTCVTDIQSRYNSNFYITLSELDSIF